MSKSLKKFEQLIVDQDIYGHAIGVHYRGSDAYKTRLGALFTLVTYILMAINTVSLIIVYRDGSRQEEKFQVTKINRFNSEAVNLSDHSLEIATFILPPLPQQVGRLVGYQEISRQKTELEIGSCSESR